MKAQQMASTGWLTKFIKRHHFSNRAKTTLCQKPPSDYAKKLVDFVVYVSQQRQKHNYQSIYAADETAVWLEDSSGKCIDEKEVSVLTTGHDKMQITVILTARSDRVKCKPYALLPRQRPVLEVVEKFKSNLVLSWAERIWMNDGWTKDYLDKIFGRSLFGKRLLVWDSFRCHISESTKKKLKEIGIYSAVVPGGCSKFIKGTNIHHQKKCRKVAVD